MQNRMRCSSTIFGVAPYQPHCVAYPSGARSEGLDANESSRPKAAAPRSLACESLSSADRKPLDSLPQPHIEGVLVASEQPVAPDVGDDTRSLDEQVGVATRLEAGVDVVQLGDESGEQGGGRGGRRGLL